MFNHRWRLFRLLGVPISLDASWLIILFLLSWTLITVFAQEVPGLATIDYTVMGVGAALAFFVCIVLHELGHALVARAVGIPMRGITLFLFGGVAEMEDEPPSAGSEFLMAIAGPAVSAVLTLIFWLWSGVTENPALGSPLSYLARINLAVLIFNMVPAFPLDGGRVLRSGLWAVLGSLRRATYWAALFGQGFAWLLIGLGILELFSGLVFPGIWLCLIGIFLNKAARGSYQQILLRQALKGEPVSKFMNPAPIVVPPELDLRHLVEDYVYQFHRKMYPVTSNGHLAGVVTTRALADFPRQEWDKHTVAEVMQSDLDPISIAPSADALQALGAMQRTGSSRLLVMEGDKLLGIVSLKDLLRFLDLKIELENSEAV
jgi:Zn-dependent protease/CBS domain-containing protein